MCLCKRAVMTRDASSPGRRPWAPPASGCCGSWAAAGAPQTAPQKLKIVQSTLRSSRSSNVGESTSHRVSCSCQAQHARHDPQGQKEQERRTAAHTSGFLSAAAAKGETRSSGAPASSDPARAACGNRPKLVWDALRSWKQVDGGSSSATWVTAASGAILPRLLPAPSTSLWFNPSSK